MRRRPPKPAGHFEAQERRRRVAAILLGILFLGGVLAASVTVFGGVMGVVVWSPLPGGFFAWWLLRGGSENRYWLRWLLMREGEGRYLEFDHVPLRFEFLGGRICFGATGVFHALESPADEAALRRLALRHGAEGFFRDARRQWWFSEGALFAWLDSRAERHQPLSVRFRTWLEKEVLPGMRRELARSGGPE
jgi:hypothetical protein